MIDLIIQNLFVGFAWVGHSIRSDHHQDWRRRYPPDRVAKRPMCCGPVTNPRYAYIMADAGKGVIAVLFASSLETWQAQRWPPFSW